jgi:hypothetical protein
MRKEFSKVSMLTVDGKGNPKVAQLPIDSQDFFSGFVKRGDFICIPDQSRLELVTVVVDPSSMVTLREGTNGTVVKTKYWIFGDAWRSSEKIIKPKDQCYSLFAKELEYQNKCLLGENQTWQ